MTDPGSQFAVLACLSAISAGAGGGLALTAFADKCAPLRSFFRFFAEFSVVAAFSALLWLAVLKLNNGDFRAFFLVYTITLTVIFRTSIAFFLSPLVPHGKKAAERLSQSFRRSFIARYILK